MPIYLKSKLKLIPKVKSRSKALLFNKAFIVVSAAYSNYSKVFSTKYIAELLKQTKINIYIIKLEKSKQSFFSTIYSLRLVKLESLKTNNKTNLANGFIQLFKSFIGAFILFDRELDENFYFCVDYRSFNNLIIKN